MSMANVNDMDAILDAALDELDEDDDDNNDDEAQMVNDETLPPIAEPPEQTQCDGTEEAKGPLTDSGPQTDEKDRANDKDAVAQSVPSIIGSAPKNPDSQWFQSLLKDFIETEDDGGDPEALLDQFMEKSLSHLPPLDDKKKKGEKSSSPRKEPARKNNSGVENSVDETINALLEDMAKASMGGDSNTTTGLEEEELLKGMFQHLQGAGAGGSGEEGPGTESSFNADAMLDGMVESLLSKDLMYEPMKQVTELFPSWLEENHSKLASEEYQQRSNQFDCFQRLVHVYETDPENVTDLLELMQQVQEYGQPPQEIINKIAPGLELDEDGMPKMNNMPFGGNEECSIM